MAENCMGRRCEEARLELSTANSRLTILHQVIVTSPPDAIPKIAAA
jgi:hypothetical protein